MASHLRIAAIALAILGQLACNERRAEESRVESDATRASPAHEPTPATPPLSPRLSRPAAAHVVAIGDLHGDLDHARRALRLAGAIDASDHWAGGQMLVVQTGDEIDRGDDDRAILDLVERLEKEAKAAGGELIPLLGNHEIMNASQDFRYVTAGGFSAFERLDASPQTGRASGRPGAFAPGGPYARLLASRPFVVKVGDSVFVHGGILPKHVRYGLDRINDELDAWLLGTRSAPPEALVANDGPVWTRAYSSDEAPADCADLTRTLALLGAKRMVVGHTVQRTGINSACEGKVWRIDVGMSRYFGGPIQVLDIDGEQVKVVRDPSPG
jgi:hypothetical protein